MLKLIAPSSADVSTESRRLFAVLAFLVLLLLVVAVVWIAGILRGRDAGEAIIAGLRRDLLPVAGLLFLLYAVVVLYGVHVESRGSAEMHQMVENETAYLLQSIGEQMPP